MDIPLAERKAVSGRIRPDVTGDGLQFIALAQNVIIKTHHP